jgi:hypothetical protein
VSAQQAYEIAALQGAAGRQAIVATADRLAACAAVTVRAIQAHIQAAEKRIAKLRAAAATQGHVKIGHHAIGLLAQFAGPVKARGGLIAKHG